MGRRTERIRKSNRIHISGTTCIYIILVISSADRFKEEDTKVLHRLEQFFGPEAVKFAMVLFTQIDETLQSCHRTIQHVKPLQRVLEAYDRRFVEFNNTCVAKNPEVCLFELFQIIDKRKDDGASRTEKYLTNDLYTNYRLKISNLLEDSRRQIRDLQMCLETQEKKIKKICRKWKNSKPKLKICNRNLRKLKLASPVKN
ncbi:unnamed protein product [Mytilus edulis]|uniref:AIG1-type G domain-containing protein n=1 Tax=Mytilus edulis TaxID=6550 RepID=A0A8S3T3L5_MYTED|nr:unnamed protein product [Mytilus edulis]